MSGASQINPLNGGEGNSFFPFLDAVTTEWTERPPPGTSHLLFHSSRMSFLVLNLSLFTEQCARDGKLITPVISS